MKKTILAFVIILIGIGCNNIPQSQKKSTEILEKMTNVCQFNPDQANKLSPIIEDFVKTRTDNMNKYEMNPQELKNANDSNRVHFMNKIKTILTPEQLEKLKAYWAQQRANKKAGGAANGGQ